MMLLGIAWFVAASALLWLTWNHVIAVLFKAQKAKLVHAILVVGTLVIFLTPRWYMHRSMMRGCPYLRAQQSCCHRSKCHESDDHKRVGTHEKDDDDDKDSD